eukprot:scaffold2723_cov108-Isochrysis_galbana.AAC.15
MLSGQGGKPLTSPTGVSGGSPCTHSVTMRSRCASSSGRTEQSSASSTAAGVSSRAPSSYSMVACSGEISVGGAMADDRWASNGEKEPHSGHRQRRECGSICAKGFSAAPHAVQQVGSRLSV